MCLVLLSFFSPAGAQQQKYLDSLQAINANIRTPDEKLSAIVNLSRSIGVSDFRGKYFVTGQGISLATFLKDSVKLGELYREKGLSFYFQGQFDSAAQYYYTSIQILEAKNDTVQLAQSLNVLGRLYRKKKEFKRSLNAYDRAMNLYSAMGDSIGLSTINNESGVVFEYMGNYAEAMRRYRISQRICEEKDYMDGLAYSTNNIGYLYMKLNDYPLAEKNLQKALQFRILMRDTFALAINYTDLAELYVKWKRYDAALSLLEKSNRIAHSMNYMDLQMTNYRLMSDAAVSQGNFRNAFYRYKDYEAVKDSIYRIESDSRIEEISTRYETEKKADENELLKKTVSLRDLEIRDKENRNRIQLVMSVSIGIIFVLAAVLALLVYFRIRREQQIRLQAEVDTAREVERRRISRDLHDNLGAQMSYMISVLDKAADNEADAKYIPALRDTAGQAIMTLRETVWAINRNEISVENFSDKFKQYILKQAEYFPDIEIAVKEEIGQNRILGPAVALNLYRLCQEAFSNALKHAHATQVTVTVRTDTQYEFYFSVRDNGRGFQPETDKKEGHYGLENMRYRAEEAGARFNISSGPGRGTTVEVFALYGKPNLS